MDQAIRTQNENADGTDRRDSRIAPDGQSTKGTVAQGRIWLDSLVGSKSESIPSIATKQGVSEKTVRSTLSLALLAPDIIGAAIEGRLPRGITVTELTDLPADWVEQHKCLGLA
jgi:site-specific DNA recombinase